MPKISNSLTNTLRKVFKASGYSFRYVETQTGIKRQSLMKFMKEEQSLRLDKADLLADFFGLELKKKEK